MIFPIQRRVHLGTVTEMFPVWNCGIYNKIFSAKTFFVNILKLFKWMRCLFSSNLFMFFYCFWVKFSYSQLWGVNTSWKSISSEAILFIPMRPTVPKNSLQAVEARRVGVPSNRRMRNIYRYQTKLIKNLLASPNWTFLPVLNHRAHGTPAFYW